MPADTIFSSNPFISYLGLPHDARSVPASHPLAYGTCPAGVRLPFVTDLASPHPRDLVRVRSLSLHICIPRASAVESFASEQLYEALLREQASMEHALCIHASERGNLNPGTVDNDN